MGDVGAMDEEVSTGLSKDIGTPRLFRAIGALMRV